jgi:hypothetical protein
MYFIEYNYTLIKFKTKQKLIVPSSQIYLRKCVEKEEVFGMGCLIGYQGSSDSLTAKIALSCTQRSARNIKHGGA